MSVAAIFVFGILCLIGGGASLYQFLDWLKTGKSMAYPLMEVLINLHAVNDHSPLYNWFYHPNSWIGFHAIVETVFRFPFSLVLVGAVLLWVFGTFESWWD